MINPQWLKLPMSRTNLHGPKDVGVIEIGLYLPGLNYFLSDCTVCHSSMDFCSNFRMSIANNYYYIEYSKKYYIIFRVIIIFEYKLSKGIKEEYLVIILGYFFLISLFLLSYFFFWDIFFCYLFFLISP